MATKKQDRRARAPRKSKPRLSAEQKAALLLALGEHFERLRPAHDAVRGETAREPRTALALRAIESVRELAVSLPLDERRRNAFEVARVAIRALWGSDDDPDEGAARISRCVRALRLSPEHEACALTRDFSARVRALPQTSRSARRLLARTYVLMLDAASLEDAPAVMTTAKVDRIVAILTAESKRRKLTATGMLARVRHVIQWGDVNEELVEKDADAIHKAVARYEARIVGQE